MGKAKSKDKSKPAEELTTMSQYCTTGEDAEAIVDYGTLLCVLVANPDAEGCLGQINRVLWLVVDHARAILAREAAIASQKSK